VSINGRTGLRGILAVLALGGAVACGGSSYGSNPTPMPTPTPAPGASADVTITIRGMQGSNSYSPNPGTVKAGQTVAWHNADSTAHTATGAGFDTGPIAGGSTSAPIRFSTAGTLDYHCSIHPTMVGSLTVTP
jgi:plastocyanin